MDLSTRVLGTTVATQLETRAASVLLRIGRDTFTRADLAGVQCFNFTAAANLSAILTKELKVKDTRDVFDHIAPRDLALPHLGAVSLAVLGAAFEAKGIGGDAPLFAWVTKHLAKGVEMTTFASVKKAATPAPARRRKAHRPRLVHSRRRAS